VIFGRARSAISSLRGNAIRAGYWFTGHVIVAGALVLFVLLALVERARSAWRRMRGAHPRLIWGPTPLLNIKYWSEAMQAIGYESRTCVDYNMPTTRPEHWDVRREDFLGDGRISEGLRSYAMFAWALRTGDVFLRYFDGGFLRGTALDWWECPLLRLAGKRLIVSPFGGDIAVPDYLGEMREATLAHYPYLEEQAPVTTRRVLHTLRWADVSIRNYQAGFQPSYDVVWPTQLGIDTRLWSPNGDLSEADGRRGEVVILHAPNHRMLKGTAHLEEAVSELGGEGLKIDLRILEGRANEEIRAAMAGADIVADQFLDPGYGFFSLEAMASGKPVLCRMSPIRKELRTPSLHECPILDSDPSRLKENLRRLIENPSLRRELGDAGRAFVLRYHSPEAMARDWGAIIEYVWRGEPLPERLLPPQPAASKS
jgi:hypothetical protein